MLCLQQLRLVQKNCKGIGSLSSWRWFSLNVPHLTCSCSVTKVHHKPKAIGSMNRLKWTNTGFWSWNLSWKCCKNMSWTHYALNGVGTKSLFAFWTLSFCANGGNGRGLEDGTICQQGQTSEKPLSRSVYFSFFWSCSWRWLFSSYCSLTTVLHASFLLNE